MKKLVCVLLLLALVLSTLIGCGGTAPVGKEAAKLLLASERLDAGLLRKKGDIFEDGAKVMRALADKAMANLNVRHENSEAQMTPLAAFTNTSTTLKGNYIGTVEIDGDTFIWRDFEENNNSYDYFQNLTGIIVSTAKTGAELIDDVKKNVRVVDKWVDVGWGTQYFLHVDEVSETLLERNEKRGVLRICRRAKTADGKDVYELFQKEELVENRMTYIPGERYELSMHNDHGDGSRDYFVADHSKGYWETYVVGAMPDHYNVSYFVMKNDICYDAFYDPKTASIPLLKIMSADRATDILSVSDWGWCTDVSLKFSGFDGIDRVEAAAEDVEYRKGEYANLTSPDRGRVILTNGNVLRYNDTFANGSTNINAIYVSFGAAGYTGEVMFNIQGETTKQRINTLKTVLNETGLRCRRNMDSVFSGIDRAYDELESIIKYYRWNGITVSDENGIAAAIDAEKARFDSMNALYVAVENEEVIDISDTGAMRKNMKFAPVSATAEEVSLNGHILSAASISLSVDDTLLFVENEPYTVALALADRNGANLVHLGAGSSVTVYAGEDSFTVIASLISLSLPALADGEYTVVAYISTEDGIRSSAYIPLPFDSVSGLPAALGTSEISAALAADRSLTVTYSTPADISVSLSSVPMDAESFRVWIAEQAFAFGTADGEVEAYKDGVYVALDGAVASVESGLYRIGYSVKNGDVVKDGHLYVQYTCNG